MPATEEMLTIVPPPPRACAGRRPWIAGRAPSGSRPACGPTPRCRAPPPYRAHPCRGVDQHVYAPQGLDGALDRCRRLVLAGEIHGDGQRPAVDLRDLPPWHRRVPAGSSPPTRRPRRPGRGRWPWPSPASCWRLSPAPPYPQDAPSRFPAYLSDASFACLRNMVASRRFSFIKPRGRAHLRSSGPKVTSSPTSPSRPACAPRSPCSSRGTGRGASPLRPTEDSAPPPGPPP